MEPFRVTCETCGAKLKVRSEEVIGEIHACPKCDSMVQILPPAGWSAIAAGTSQELKSPVISDAPMASMPDFEVAGLEPPPVALPTIDISTDSVPPADVIAPTDFASPAAASNSLWMIAAIGGAAVLVVGGVIGVMWPRGEEPKVAAAPAIEAAAPAVVEEQAEASTNEAPPVESAEADAEPSEAAPQTAVAQTTVETPAELPEPPKQEVAAPTDAPSAEATAVTPAPAVEQEASKVAERSSDEPKQAAVMKFDPLSFDPSELTLAPTTAVTNTPGSVSAEAEVVINANDEPGGDGKAQADGPPVQPVVDRTLSVRLGPMVGAAPRVQDVHQQLSLRLNAFEVNAVPLADFVASLSEIANVPITISPASLELTGISATQQVSVKSADASIEHLVKDTLAKYRLEMVETAGQLKLAPVNGERRRVIEYDIADLVGSDGGKQLTTLIQQFVAPESWQAGGGTIEVQGTKLRVDHVQNVRHQVLIFCERLRLARGLSPRSRYPAALLSVEPAHAQLAAKLREKTTFTFLPWSRLNDVVQHWQETSGVTILVDWAALADVELAPASLVAASAIDRTWGEVLDGVLEPMDLAWWPARNNSIQITTREAIEDVRRIEFYAVPEVMRGQFANETALLEAVQAAAASAESGEKLVDRIQFDGPSKRLIVLAAPEAHRAIARYLAGDGERLSKR